MVHPPRVDDNRTMVSSRALAALALGASLLIAACSTGSDDSGADVQPTAADPTTMPTTTIVTVPEPGPEALTYEQLAAQALEGEVDELTLVLSEFAALFGVEVPGAILLQVDDSLPTLGTDVLQEITRLDDQLTDAQRSIIDARLDEVLDGEIVYDTRDDEAYQALFDATADDVATTEPQGFASRRVRQFDERDIRAVAAEAAVAYVIELGGRPLLMSVSTASAEAARTTEVDGLTSFFDVGGVRTCTVTIYERERNQGAHLVSVIGHEVFHCWQHTNASSDTASASFAGFYKEGLATWVGEQFAAGLGFPTGSDFGWNHLRGFLRPSDFSLFATKYTAYGFWSQVAELRGGPDQLWPIIPSLNSVGTDRVVLFDMALGGVDELRRAELAASSTRRPEWSPAWDFTALGIPSEARPILEQVARPGTPNQKLVSEGQQAIVEFDLSSLDAGTNWIVTRSNAGLTYNRLGDFDEYATRLPETTRFCYGDACVCPDGSTPFADLIALPRSVTALTVALTGSATEGASTSVDVADVADFCDEPVDTSIPGSGTFTGNGTWRATAPALTAMFTNASAFGFGAEALSIAGVTGEVLMELRDDGTGTLTYRRVTAFINDSQLQDLTIDGTGRFQFGVEGGVLTVSGNTFTVSASSSGFGDPLVITDRDIEGGAGGTSTYTVGFDGEQLVLTSAEGARGAVFFPTTWTRER